MPYETNVDKILKDEKVLKQYMASSNSIDDYDTSMRVFNSPFCLLNSVDPSINSQVQLGRKYMECIASNQSTVYFLPGTATFMPEVDKEQRESMKAAIADEAGDVINEILTVKGGRDGVKYFDHHPDYMEYMKYVNLLCRTMSVYLGIGDLKGPNGDKYKYYNWQNFKGPFKPQKKITGTFQNGTLFEKEESINIMDQIFGNFQYVKFYADTGTSSSESFSNGTTESKIAGMVSSGSDLVKELYFLGDFIDSKSVSSAVDTAKGAVEQIVSKISGDTGARLGNLATSMINGNSILFPEIYANSDYAPSYNLRFNLLSPYGDTESVFLNVWVPFFHLLAMVCPRQVKNQANSYASPFIIKAFSRGWFNCNMGIVDSLSVEKGSEWNVNGLATNLQITMSIKDLYSNMMISKSTEPGSFFANQSLMDYLAINSGLDVSKPHILKDLELMAATILGSIKQVDDLIYDDMIVSVQRIVGKLMGR